MTKPSKGTLGHAIGLRHIEEWQAISIVIFTLALLTFRFQTYSPLENWFISILGFMTSTCFCWYCATIVHNTIHVPPFREKWKNKWWQLVLCLTYGFPVASLIPGHNLSHHAYAQTQKDVIRTDKMRFEYNFFNLICFFCIVAPSICEQDGLYVREMRKRSKPIWFQIRNEFFWSLVWQIGLCYFGGWGKYLVVIFFPQMIAKLGLITINLYQHDGLPGPDEDEFNFSRNFVDPKLNFFTCNNGYHTAHHMSPGTHWSGLEKYHEKNVKPYMNSNLDVPSIIWFTIKYFVLPGGRTDKNGDPYVIPPPREDIPWFTTDQLTNETYSDGSHF